MTTTPLVISRVGTTDRDHDHRLVSDRVSDRVEHPPALPLLTARVDARWGGDSVRHLGPPSPFSSLFFFPFSASSDD